ncbi:ATP-binding cassette, subfamily B [Anaerobium acetethylicum]|uniref:ATP-binding cassette, subfamily B n=2 Tax=Anaerobium acetethylicum TaxID=1619234 RepID=A0A1D3TTT5_9FIRM|nr:ABC transporter ATP-binding protein [Anaerobium acetethylicum]SCP97376.1 ATP-binding cassette, subfamily B [Anaerobium acetethylicum]
MKQSHKTESIDAAGKGKGQNAGTGGEQNPGTGREQNPGTQGKKQRASGKTMKRLISYVVKEYKLSLLVVLAAIILSSVANVGGTLFLKKLIDGYILPMIGQTEQDYSPLLKALSIMALIYFGGIVSTYVYSRIMIYVAQGSLKKVRNDMFAHMESLPIGFFDSHAHGNIMSLYTNDTDTLRQMISQSMPQLAASVITIVSIAISMLILNIPLTLVEVLMMVLIVYLTKYIGGKSGKYFMLQQKDLGSVNGYIEEMMEGQKVVKVFCHEKEAKNKFDELNDGLFESADSANKYANALMPVLGNLGYVNYVLVAILGALLAISGISGFTLGGIAAFLQLARSLNGTVMQISGQLNAVIMAFAGAERIFRFLDEKPETDEGYVTLVNVREDEDGGIEEVKERTGVWAWRHPHADGTVTYKKVCGDVAFDDVDFGYTEEKMVLHNVKMFAKPSQKIAFVGSTGAGKTTITNLINRFYDIQDGKIRYDGININKIKKDDLRRSLGIVLQDTHLFTGTIADNIRYGKLEATREEVIAAAKLANADLFIRHLPEGYDTMISGDGANLSQGQRQLLAIARAAIFNPPVLILDEATSSIDTRTEAIVQEGMDKLMEGRTVFVIAHRLSTVRNSDVIMVMENGRIIERGDHEELIGKKGKYYQLYTGAFELA